MAKEPEVVRILVEDPITIKGSLPLPGDMGSLTHKVIEVGKSTLAGSIRSISSVILDALEDASATRPNFGISEVKFSLAFDAKGEASIVSIAKGSVDAKTALDIVIRRTPK